MAAAFAVGRRHPGPVDYVLFGSDECMAVQCEGDTPDEGVNAVHYNIRDLNDEEIISFADMLVDKMSTRIPKPEVNDAIKDSIAWWTGKLAAPGKKRRLEWKQRSSKPVRRSGN